MWEHFCRKKGFLREDKHGRRNFSVTVSAMISCNKKANNGNYEEYLLLGYDAV
jgi:hypothetical protein